MTTRAPGDDGSIADLPWATVFDPAANARALSAIQAEGFRAASRIVDRFARAAAPEGRAQPTGDGPTNGAAAAGADGAGAAGLPDVERLTRAWWSTLGQFLLRATPTSGAAIALDGPGATGALTLQAPVPGSAGAEVWLHNRGPDDHADIRLRCSDLLSCDGDVIGAEAVLIDTAVVAMPRRSSRGVAITVHVAPQVRPGVYRGTLLAGGHPDLWLPVVLTVRPADS